VSGITVVKLFPPVEIYAKVFGYSI